FDFRDIKFIALFSDFFTHFIVEPVYDLFRKSLMQTFKKITDVQLLTFDSIYLFVNKVHDEPFGLGTFYFIDENIRREEVHCNDFAPRTRCPAWPRTYHNRSTRSTHS